MTHLKKFAEIKSVGFFYNSILFSQTLCLDFPKHRAIISLLEYSGLIVKT